MNKIKTYATSANLGPGFDVLGLCFDIANEFSFEKSDHFQLIGFEEEFNNDDNLVLKSYMFLFNFLNKDPIPIKIIANCAIPTTRGLGSSSSCIVAGISIANSILNHPFTKYELCKFATAIEGHPDNVVPCILGGLCGSKLMNDELFYVNYPLHPSVKFLALIPNYELSTKEARAVLPESILRSESIDNNVNTLLLLEGIKIGSKRLISSGIHDNLHTQYRRKLIREYDEIEKIMLRFGAVGFTISGAGPTCLAIFTNEIPMEAIQLSLKSLQQEIKAIELSVNNNGVIEEN